MTRNKKIFLITTIAIVGMCLVWFLNSGMNKISGDIFQAYADPDLYKNALALANNNSEVKAHLGTLQDLGKMAILEGETTYSNEHRHVRTSVTVQGEKGKARLDIEADNINDKWNYSVIRIRIKRPPENKRIIEILDK